MSTARHVEDSAADFMATWSRAAGPLNDRAEKHLFTCDPMLGEVIRAVGPQRFAKSPAGSHFDAIARSIIYQQLSKKAAATIYTRYRDIAHGRASVRRGKWRPAAAVF